MRLDAEAVVRPAARCGNFVPELLRPTRFSRALRLLERDAGLEPRRRAEVVPLIASCSGSSWNGSQTSGGGPNSRNVNSAHDADDEVRLAAERDRLADDVWIAAEAALPELSAEHDDALAARQILLDA